MKSPNAITRGSCSWVQFRLSWADRNLTELQILRKVLDNLKHHPERCRFDSYSQRPCAADEQPMLSIRIPNPSNTHALRTIENWISNLERGNSIQFKKEDLFVHRFGINHAIYDEGDSTGGLSDDEHAAAESLRKPFGKLSISPRVREWRMHQWPLALIIVSDLKWKILYYSIILWLLPYWIAWMINLSVLGSLIVRRKGTAFISFMLEISDRLLVNIYIPKYHCSLNMKFAYPQFRNLWRIDWWRVTISRKKDERHHVTARPIAAARRALKPSHPTIGGSRAYWMKHHVILRYWCNSDWRPGMRHGHGQLNHQWLPCATIITNSIRSRNCHVLLNSKYRDWEFWKGIPEKMWILICLLDRMQAS